MSGSWQSCGQFPRHTDALQQKRMEEIGEEGVTLEVITLCFDGLPRKKFGGRNSAGGLRTRRTNTKQRLQGFRGSTTRLSLIPCFRTVRLGVLQVFAGFR